MTEPRVAHGTLAGPLRHNRYFQAMYWSQTCTDVAEQLVIVSITWAALHTFGGGRLGLVLAAGRSRADCCCCSAGYWPTAATGGSSRS